MQQRLGCDVLMAEYDPLKSSPGVPSARNPINPSIGDKWLNNTGDLHIADVRRRAEDFYNSREAATYDDRVVRPLLTLLDAVETILTEEQQEETVQAKTADASAISEDDHSDDGELVIDVPPPAENSPTHSQPQTKSELYEQLLQAQYSDISDASDLSSEEDMRKESGKKSGASKRGTGKKAKSLSNIEELHQEARQKRLAQELPGFNWLEDKIKSGQLNRPPSFDQSEASQVRNQNSESVYQSSSRRKTIDVGESYRAAGVRYGPIAGRTVPNNNCISVATTKAADTDSLPIIPQSPPVSHLMSLPHNPYYPCSVGSSTVPVPTTTMCSFSMSNAIPRISTIPTGALQHFTDINCTQPLRPMNPYIMSKVIDSSPSSSNNNFICARIKRTVPILSQTSSVPLVASGIQSQPLSLEKVTAMHVPVISTTVSSNSLSSPTYYNMNNESEVTHSDPSQSHSSHSLSSRTVTFQESRDSVTTNAGKIYMADVQNNKCQMGPTKMTFDTCNAVNLSTTVRKQSQDAVSPNSRKYFKHSDNEEIAIIDSDHNDPEDDNEKLPKSSEAEVNKSTQRPKENFKTTKDKERTDSENTEFLILPDSSQMSPVMVEAETEIKEIDLSKTIKGSKEVEKVTEFVDLVDDIIGLDELPNRTLDDWDGGSMEVLNLSVNKNKTLGNDFNEIRNKDYSEKPISSAKTKIHDTVSQEGRRSTIMHNSRKDGLYCLQNQSYDSELINLSKKPSIPSHVSPKTIRNAPQILQRPLPYYCGNSPNFQSVHCDGNAINSLPKLQSFYSESSVPKAIASASKSSKNFSRSALHSPKTNIGSLQLELDRRKKELDFLERLANDHQIEQERLRIAMREKEELLLKIEQLRQESSKTQPKDTTFVKGNQILSLTSQDTAKPRESEFLVHDMRKRKSSSPSYCHLAEKKHALNSPNVTVGSVEKTNPASLNFISAKATADAKKNSQDSILSSLLVSSSAMPFLGYQSRSHPQNFPPAEKRIAQWPEQKDSNISSSVSSCFTCEAIENAKCHKHGGLLNKTSTESSIHHSNRTPQDIPNILNSNVNVESVSKVSEVSNLRPINSSVPQSNSLSYFPPANPPLTYNPAIKYSQSSVSSSGTSAFSKPGSCNPNTFPQRSRAPRMPTLPYQTSIGSFENQWSIVGNPMNSNPMIYPTQQLHHHLGLMHPNLPHGQHYRMIPPIDHSTSFHQPVTHNLQSAFTRTRSPCINDCHLSQINKQNEALAKSKRTINPSPPKNAAILPRCYNRSSNCIRPVQFVCSSCTSAWYCSLECQMQDWPRHCRNCII